MNSDPYPSYSSATERSANTCAELDDKNEVASPVRCWLEIAEGEQPRAGATYRIGVEVKTPANADWGDRNEIDLLVSLVGLGTTGLAAEVLPETQPVKLSKIEQQQPLVFDVTFRESGELSFFLSIYLERELTLLQEYEFSLTVPETDACPQ